MKKKLSVAALIVTSLLSLSLAFAGDDGKALFEQNCSTCHGADAKGVQGLGKDLTTSAFTAKKKDDELVAFIKEGRAGDDPLNTTGIPMPPKAGNPALSDDDLKAIVKYLRAMHKS